MPARLTATVLASLAAIVAGGWGALAAAPVDETALRYYAASRQHGRVEAETKRLQGLHPGWRPPADIWLEELGRADEGPLWALFAADRLDELQAAIDARRRKERGWAPSRNLGRKLEAKLLRAAILRDARAGRWSDVASLAGRLDDENRDPELMWLVAEGMIRARREAEGQAVLGRILASSREPAVRIATIQKALALLHIDGAEALIGQGEAGPDGVAEFASIGHDIARARIVAHLRRQRAEPVPAAEVAAFATRVRQEADASGSALLGWYGFARRDWAEALDWFKLAIAQDGDAMTAHGLAHTLRKLGHSREAEDVAYAWREPLVQNAILYIDILEAWLTAETPPRIEPERLERYARVVAEAQSGEGAQAIAWYARNLCQDEVALAWFERAVAWFPKEATVMGYADALRRMKRGREFIEVVNRYDGLFPSVVALLFKTDAPRPPPTCDASGRIAAATLDEAAPRRAPLLVPRPPGDGLRVAEARRADFPLPVASENPRREPTVKAGGAPAGGWRREAGDKPPLVARRVLGVLPMPYEALGLSLLPAHDGTQTPAGIAASDAPAPAGSAWAQERSASPPSTIATGRDPSGRPAEPGSRFAGRGRVDQPPASGAAR